MPAAAVRTSMKNASAFSSSLLGFWQSLSLKPAFPFSRC